MHSHPYTESIMGTLSYADIASLLANAPQRFSLIQSGDYQGMLLKTQQTPSLNFSEEANVRAYAYGRYSELRTGGNSVLEASRQTVLEYASKYHMVYYEGAHGTLQRVYP